MSSPADKEAMVGEINDNDISAVELDKVTWSVTNGIMTLDIYDPE